MPAFFYCIKKYENITVITVLLSFDELFLRSSFPDELVHQPDVAEGSARHDSIIAASAHRERIQQPVCRGSVTFWCGSGSVDPYL